MLKIVLLVVCVALPLGAPKEHRHRLREYKRSLDVDKVPSPAPNLYRNLPRFREAHDPKIKAATEHFQQRMRKLKSGEFYSDPADFRRQLSMIQKLHQIAITLQALKEKIKRDAAELMREKEEQFEAERDYWMEKYRHRQPPAPAPAPPPPARAPPACPAGTTSINGICVKINGL